LTTTPTFYSPEGKGSTHQPDEPIKKPPCGAAFLMIS
jgi:hypothetical protein